ncbi:MAG TPA: nitrite reductase (NAD(P)H) small subunit [Bacteroidia bacterium]
MKEEIRWVKLFGHINELENFVALNKINTLVIEGKKICVAHTTKGFYAIQDKCPHNGASLSFGYCNDEANSIVCPLHRYHFSLETGRALSGIADAARVYPIKSDDNGVYIGFKEFVWSWRFWE